MRGLLSDRDGRIDLRRPVIAVACGWEAFAIATRHPHTITGLTRGLRRVHPVLPWLVAVALSGWLFHHLAIERP